jgi:predicted kinase
MLNWCPNCGEYKADRTINPTGPFAICPFCGHKQLFKQLPLLTVSGASGVGKSTICGRLIGTINEAVLLDADLMWRSELNHPENNYREFIESCLRLSKNISQSGRPVVLFGAGTGVPMNVEPCVERRYFSKVHYLALVCNNEEITRRLQARKNWRGKDNADYLVKQVEFNAWFKESGTSLYNIDLVDTTSETVEQTADRVAVWIHKNLQT